LTNLSRCNLCIHCSCWRFGNRCCLRRNESNRLDRWIREAIHIRKEQDKLV